MNEQKDENRETVEDILAEMRREIGDGTDTYSGKRIIHRMEDDCVRQYCDRIEAAWKREKAEWEAAACAFVSDAVMSGKVAVEHAPVGNAAAMREALVEISKIADDWQSHANTKAGALDRIYELATAALATPPRNCDLPLVVDGPANNNADKAWQVFKQAHPEAYFDVSGLLRCIDWLLAPAAERKGGAE